MPRFYFDVHDGVSGLDSSGAECCDRRDACSEAIRRAERLLAEEPDWFRTCQAWQIEVSESSGKSFLKVTFKAIAGGVMLESTREGLSAACGSCERPDLALAPTRRTAGPSVSPAGSADRHAFAALP